MLVRQCLIFFCICVFTNSDSLASNPTAVEQYGHHVSIRVAGEHICSGSIISSRFILTSHSCISLYGSADDITIVAGTKSLEVFGDSYQIEKVIISDSPLHEIALLRTQRDIIFHDDIRLIELGDYNKYADNYELSYTGWEDSEMGGKQEILQHYTAQLYDKIACKEEHDFGNFTYMCMYDPSDKEICNREPGGAIVADGIQIGIYIERWCYKGASARKYTPVYPYFGWLLENTALVEPATIPSTTLPPLVKEHESKHDAPAGAYPYHASIRHNSQHVCSGSIISKRHILTSINCIMRFAPWTLTVMVGISSLNEVGAIYQGTKVERFPGYKYDIAIIHLTTDITFNDRVNAIPIVKDDEPYRDSEEITLTGWQRKNTCGSSSNKLQHIQYQILATGKCEQLIPFLNPVYMCSLEQTSHTCNMDYGAPIVSNGVQIALNPARVGCGEKFQPHLHLPLNSAVKWIKRHSRVRV